MKRTTKLTAITVALAGLLIVVGPGAASAAEDGSVAAVTEFGADDTWVPPAGTSTGGTSGTGESATQTRAATDSDVLALHNDERRAKGLKALSMDAVVQKYANRHSRQMAEKGYLYHTSSLASVLGNRKWTIAGENVGVGGSAEDVMDAFMKSASHRKNILRSGYDNAGVGVYTDKKGLVWITVVFYG